MGLNDFISATDYGTLKNDTQSNSVSITISNGQVVAAGSSVVISNTVSAGTISAGLRARGSTTKNPGEYVGTTLYTTSSCSVVGEPGFVSVTLYCSLERISAAQVKLSTSIDNPSGGTMTITQSQTVTFVFSTSVSPFD